MKRQAVCKLFTAIIFVYPLNSECVMLKDLSGGNMLFHSLVYHLKFEQYQILFFFNLSRLFSHSMMTACTILLCKIMVFMPREFRCAELQFRTCSLPSATRGKAVWFGLDGSFSYSVFLSHVLLFDGHLCLMVTLVHGCVCVCVRACVFK